MKRKKCTCLTQEQLLAGMGSGGGVGAYSFCLVMSLYIKNAHYVCLLCVGWRRLRCFIVPSPPPTSSFCLCIAVSTSQKRIRREILFFPPFHQQFMMERCSTYSSHPPNPQPPTVRWLHSIKASLLRCLQSRCRLKPRFPSTWELKIEGMMGSHLIISGYTGLTGRSLSLMCMTNERNIYINTPSTV